MKQVSGSIKLLIYSDYFLPSVGGVETSVELLARGLTNRFPDGDPSSADRIEITLVTQTASNGMDDSIFPYRVVRRPRFIELVRIMLQSDVVHLAGPCLVPLALTRVLGKPTVVEHHGYQVSCPNGLLLLEPQKTCCPGHFMAKRYRKCLKCNSYAMGLWKSLKGLLLMFPRRWLCQKIEVNVTITEHVLFRLGLPRSRTVYYGVENVNPRPIESEEGIERPLRLAYLGRLVSEKGLPVLFRAVQLLEKDGLPFRLTVIGDGPQRNNLEALANEIGIDHRVTLAGVMQRQQVDEALRMTDVVVMPSLWEETAGLAAIEQMMSGGAVVVSDIGGLAEVVGDAGLKFAPGSSEELYSCLKIIAEDRRKIRQLGSLGRARALKEFSAGRYIMQHAALYRELRHRRRHS
jgi:glycosyltransferase involved in cell wall biosynthesis